MGTCAATFRVVGTTWPGGFQGAVTVRAGTSGLNGWTVRWTNPAGQVVTQLWGGQHTPSGQASTVVAMAWNGTVPPNATVESASSAPRASADPTLTNLTCTDHPHAIKTSGFAGGDVTTPRAHLHRRGGLVDCQGRDENGWFAPCRERGNLRPCWC